MFAVGLFPQARIVTLSNRRREPHRVVVDGAEVGSGLSWDSCYGDMRRRYDVHRVRFALEALLDTNGDVTAADIKHIAREDFTEPFVMKILADIRLERRHEPQAATGT